MALTDSPEIRIDGQPVTGAWSDAQRIALDGLRITWGRGSHVEKSNPSQLYCELIDPRAHLNGYTSLTGRPIEVWRAASATDPARRIFNGRIDDYDVELTWIRDPHTHERRRVWRLSVIASDKLAELAKAVLPGPGENELLVGAVGPAYWGLGSGAQVDYVSASEHIVSMMQQGADELISAIDWRDPYPDEPSSVRMIPWAEKRSVLDLIEGIYAAHPLGYPIYEPSSDSVLIGKPAVGPDVALTWDGSTLDIAVQQGGYAIPASRVVVPDGYTARTGVDESIDVVQVTAGGTRIGDDGDGGFAVEFLDSTTEHAVSLYDVPAYGRREHRIEVDFLQAVKKPDNPDPDPEPGGAYQWPFPLSNVTSEYGWRDSTQSFHAGIDFAYGGIGGAAIHPVGPGTIAQVVNWHSGWGNYVVVDHGDGLSSLYAHMQQPSTMVVGQVVDQATTLGYVGNTGNSFGDHLHMETWLNGQHMNPRSWMDQYGSATTGMVATAGAIGDGTLQQLIAADTADALEQLRGAAVMPTLRLDWRNFEYDYPVTYGWLDTACKQVPVYFPGSVFADLLDAAQVHQIIGGTLVYADGWTHDITVAPALTHGESILVDELVTIDAPTIGDFADDVTIGDLGNVTIGVN